MSLSSFYQRNAVGVLQRAGHVEREAPGEVAVRAQRGPVPEQQTQALGRVELAAQMRRRAALSTRDRLPPGKAAPYHWNHYTRTVAVFYALTKKALMRMWKKKPLRAQCKPNLLNGEFCMMNSRMASAWNESPCSLITRWTLVSAFVSSNSHKRSIPVMQTHNFDN